jgi:integrase
VQTLDVLKRVIGGKRMSLASRDNYEAVFRSLNVMYAEFPTKQVEVNEWLVSLEDYADTTVRLWFTLLREACKYMEDNYGLNNPCKGLKAPKVRKHKRRYFSVEEIAKILKACRDEEELALVMTLIDSTCRVGELSGLKVRDVGDSWIDVKGKTGEKRYRLDSRICEVLHRLGEGRDDTIFNKTSEALSMRVIRICRRAGITGRKLGPHTLRHSSASMVARETKNVMAVKALLQHDRVDTSFIYIHDVEDELQKSISPLGLFASKISEEQQVKMLPGGRDGEVEGEFEEVSGDNGDAVDDLVLEMFPEVRKGVEIRPLLRTEDLELIRRGFLAIADNGKHDVDVDKARELMKRIMRRVK